MKLLLAILVFTVFALSLWADYRWRKWVKSREQTHPDQLPRDSTHRNP